MGKQKSFTATWLTKLTDCKKFLCKNLYFSRVKEGEIENQSTQICQLKKYIGESENIPKPAEVARREKEALVTKLKVSFTDKVK